jgi:NAD(P)-dependent dehydrogenase (short-subunit alcohol dehydrogenase family)
MSTPFRERSLAGKVAYVAGGTRGINLGIARCYAEHGAHVVVMSRDEKRCAAAEAELRSLGAKALGLPADVRDYDRVAKTLQQAAESFGPLDIVVAGQAGNFYAPALGMSANGFKAVVDIDLLGTFNVFRASFEFLRRPGACLIAITAPEAVKPLHFQSHVCAAKAGVNMLCKCLALEWGPAGVRVNGISPGPIEDSFGMQTVAAPTPELRERITRAVPLRRFGHNSDIANTALFLATDAASYITGTIIDTDGGVAIASPESGSADAVFNLKSDARVRGPKRA